VILPTAMAAFVGGLKQGWAFAWRSLMAGELLVIIANRPSIGVRVGREMAICRGNPKGARGPVYAHLRDASCVGG
jgi:NitT/TauT family transport system permease protein